MYPYMKWSSPYKFSKKTWNTQLVVRSTKPKQTILKIISKVERNDYPRLYQREKDVLRERIVFYWQRESCRFEMPWERDET